MFILAYLGIFGIGIAILLAFSFLGAMIGLLIGESVMVSEYAVPVLIDLFPKYKDLLERYDNSIFLVMLIASIILIFFVFFARSTRISGIFYLCTVFASFISGIFVEGKGKISYMIIGIIISIIVTIAASIITLISDMGERRGIIILPIEPIPNIVGDVVGIIPMYAAIFFSSLLYHVMGASCMGYTLEVNYEIYRGGVIHSFILGGVYVLIYLVISTIINIKMLKDKTN